MTIQVDTREKARAIKKILAEFDRQGVKHYSSKLFVGDYMSLDNPRLIIDRKQNLGELSVNFDDNPKRDEFGRVKRDKNGRVMTNRRRFTDEIKRAVDCGIKIVILCEHGGQVKEKSDIIGWKNPVAKTHPMVISGDGLFRLISFYEKKYGVEFLFCDKRETGKRIIEILGGADSG